MAVSLRLISRRSCFLSFRDMNFRGQFGRCSYHIAQKTAEVLQQKVSLTGLECEIHNNKIPTYKQVQNSPELQEKLAKMYKAYAQDPDFHQKFQRNYSIKDCVYLPI